jgi:serine/threonine protein kinase/Tol biopolymer transport system component
MAGLIGQQLGQYTITATLGSGGMATVYRARQASVGRDVAIKVIKIELVNDHKFVERFRQEARIIAALDHLHIIKLFDFGTQDDLLYLVMELKTGGSLAAHLKARGKLNAEEAARYLDQIGAALDHAHSRSVIHRDLKPQNVLLDEQNNAFLSDFGIARIVSELSKSVTVLGTPEYMSPEQWEGKNVDRRADIYGLAIMTYKLLTNTLPFTGDTPPVLMYKHLHEPPPPIRRLRPDLSQRIEDVLMKGMAKRPEDRFQSAPEFAAAFRTALGERMPKDVETKKVLAQPPQPPEVTKTHVAAPISAANLNRVVELQKIERLGLVFSVAWSSDGYLASGLPSGTICVWRAVTGQRIWERTEHSESVFSVVWSPDGRYLASSSKDGMICVWESANGQLVRRLRRWSGRVNSVAWSPDGRYLASGSDDKTVRVWSAADGNLVQTLTGHTGAVWSVVWSPDGSYLASGSEDRTVCVWKFETGQRVQVIAEHTDEVNSVAWSPDGRHLASGSADRTVRVWKSETRRKLQTLAGHSGSVWSVTWSPDGRYLISGSEDSTIRVWDAGTGRQLRTLTSHTDKVRSVAWSSDGHFIASGSLDGTIRIWGVPNN